MSVIPQAKRAAQFGWFALRVKQRMEALGLSVTDLGRKLRPENHVAGGSSVSLWTQARGMPGHRYRVALAQTLDMPEDELYRHPDGTVVPVHDMAGKGKKRGKKPGRKPGRKPGALVPVAAAPPEDWGPAITAERVKAPANGNGHGHTEMLVRDGYAEIRVLARVPVGDLDRVVFGLRQLGLM